MSEEYDFIIEVDVGDDVICDYCNAEYTDLPDCGGLIVGSWAVCPECAPETTRRLIEYNEQDTVDAVCPDGVSFADFVRASR